MQKAFLLVLVAAAAIAQTPRGPNPAPVTLGNAPLSGERLEFRELLSTTSQRICSRHTIDSSRTSATVLAIAASASATVPEYVRFGAGNNAVTGNTTTATLSGGGAADVGTVFVYARRSTAGALTLYVGHNLPGATITCAGSPGCTVETGVTAFPTNATPIYTWQVSNANWSAGTGIDQGAQSTCWIDQLSFVNTTAGAVTVTVSDAQNSALSFLNAASIAANTTYIVNLPGGMRFDAGATWVAGSNSAITAYARTSR